MKNLGLDISERYPVIYYISGKQALFDTQIVVTKQLDKKRTGHCVFFQNM